MEQPVDDPDERELLEVALTAAAHQRAAAFERLIRPVAPPLERWLRSRGCADHEIEDVLQETWERAFRRLGSYEPSGRPIAAWFFGIAKNVHREVLRKRLLLFDERPPDVVADGDIASEVVEEATRSQFRQRVTSLIAGAPDTYREYIEAALAGFEAKEIMELYGWSRPKTDTTKHRAIRWVRDEWVRQFGTIDQSDWL